VEAYKLQIIRALELEQMRLVMRGSKLCRSKRQK